MRIHVDLQLTVVNLHAVPLPHATMWEDSAVKAQLRMVVATVAYSSPPGRPLRRGPMMLYESVLDNCVVSSQTGW